MRSIRAIFRTFPFKSLSLISPFLTASSKDMDAEYVDINRSSPLCFLIVPSSFCELEVTSMNLSPSNSVSRCWSCRLKSTNTNNNQYLLVFDYSLFLVAAKSFVCFIVNLSIKIPVFSVTLSTIYLTCFFFHVLYLLLQQFGTSLVLFRGN